MIFFKVTKYLIFDLCIERFFQNLTTNISSININGEFMNVDGVVEKYFPAFARYLSTVDTMMVTGKIVEEFFQRNLKIYLEPHIMKLISEEMILMLIFKGSHGGYRGSYGNMDDPDWP
jgi:hypothetical protein